MDRKTPAFDTNYPGSRDTQAPAYRIARFICASLQSAVVPAGKQVMLCHRTDGLNDGSRNILVAPYYADEPVAAGTRFFAMIPQGGTGWTVTGSVSGLTRPVLWIQTADSSEGQYQYFVRMMVAQHRRGWSLPKAHPPVS